MTMNSESKTTEDLLREMREYADQLDNDGDITGADFRDFANQLEEAMKREKVETATIAAVKAINLTNEKWIRDAGNVVAMREALIEVRSLLWELMGSSSQSRQEITACNMARKIRDALDAPIRHCDKYANTALALGAYPDGPPVGEEWDDADWMMFLDWLFAPVGGKREN